MPSCLTHLRTLRRRPEIPEEEWLLELATRDDIEDRSLGQRILERLFAQQQPSTRMTRMSQTRDRIWLIERLALDEAPEDVELTASEQRRLAALTAEDGDIRARYPTANLVPQIRARARRIAAQATRRPPLYRAGAALATVGAVALAAVIWTGGKARNDVGPAQGIRLKGRGLALYKKTSDGASVLRPGAVLRPGERIQIGDRLDQRAFVAIVSVDGRGVVTLHHPEQALRSVSKVDAGVAQLPFSYVLDDAPLYERFFLVTASRRFEAQTVIRAAEALAKTPHQVTGAPLPLPGTFTQDDFLLRKETLK